MGRGEEGKGGEAWGSARRGNGEGGSGSGEERGGRRDSQPGEERVGGGRPAAKRVGPPRHAPPPPAHLSHLRSVSPPPSPSPSPSPRPRPRPPPPLAPHLHPAARPDRRAARGAPRAARCGDSLTSRREAAESSVHRRNVWILLLAIALFAPRLPIGPAAGQQAASQRDRLKLAGHLPARLLGRRATPRSALSRTLDQNGG